MELVLEASHPRIAGIVQTHRQHIDAPHGQHGDIERRIEGKDVISRAGRMSSRRQVPAGSARFYWGRFAVLQTRLPTDAQTDPASDQTGRSDSRRQRANEVLRIEQVLDAEEYLRVAAHFT